MRSLMLDPVERTARQQHVAHRAAAESSRERDEKRADCVEPALSRFDQP
jgi:hypothetical protein